MSVHSDDPIPHQNIKETVRCGTFVKVRLLVIQNPAGTDTGKRGGACREEALDVIVSFIMLFIMCIIDLAVETRWI